MNEFNQFELLKKLLWWNFGFIVPFRMFLYWVNPSICFMVFFLLWKFLWLNEQVLTLLCFFLVVSMEISWLWWEINVWLCTSGFTFSILLCSCTGKWSSTRGISQILEMAEESKKKLKKNNQMKEKKLRMKKRKRRKDRNSLQS